MSRDGGWICTHRKPASNFHSTDAANCRLARHNSRFGSRSFNKESNSDLHLRAPGHRVVVKREDLAVRTYYWQTITAIVITAMVSHWIAVLLSSLGAALKQLRVYHDEAKCAK